MEGEIYNFLLVWTSVAASLCYCHAAGRIFPSAGPFRVLSILPISCFFFWLPLNLFSIHLGGTTSFFIAWLASFKLILFAFDKGPLSSNPPIPLRRFVPLAKIVVLAVLVRVYDFMEFLHPKILMLCYCLHMYVALEMILGLVAAVVRALFRVELEPQFDEPYLCTSLQDFWGRRWNLMVSNILQPTVYHPVRSVSARLIGRKWAPMPAVLAAFFVSGLMHELVFYNFGRLQPTGEVMCYFLLHGVSLCVEIGVKKAVNGKFTLPGMVSGAAALSYVILTSFWLFFPPFLRAKADWKGCTESVAFIEFVKTRRLGCPADDTGCKNCLASRMESGCPGCIPIMQCMAGCLWGSTSRSKCIKKCDCNGGYPRLSDCKKCLSQCKCRCKDSG